MPTLYMHIATGMKANPPCYVSTFQTEADHKIIFCFFIYTYGINHRYDPQSNLLGIISYVSELEFHNKI